MTQEEYTRRKLALTVEDVADLIGLSKPSVYALLKRRERPLPHFRYGRAYRIPRHALEAWLEDEAREEASA